MAYLWIAIVVLHFPVVFALFFLFDLIVRAEYSDHRSAWEADGQPHGFFWVPRESTLAGGLLGAVREFNVPTSCLAFLVVFNAGLD